MYLCSCLLTASYVMNVIACPGIILIRRGVRPFQRAPIPSSFAIRITEDPRPLYFGA